MNYPVSDPTVGLVGGKFSDGDPVGGVPPSRDPAVWANAVTDELLNVLAGLGVTPDEADNGQIIDALIANFAGILGSAAQVFRVATAVGANDATPLAQVQSLIAAGLRVYVGSYSRDISLAGNQTITGVGFTPKAAFVFAGGAGNRAMSVGVSGANASGGIHSTTNVSDNTFAVQDAAISLVTNVGDWATASFTAWSADGGTLTWTKNGSPSSTYQFKVLFLG